MVTPRDFIRRATGAVALVLGLGLALPAHAAPDADAPGASAKARTQAKRKKAKKTARVEKKRTTDKRGDAIAKAAQKKKAGDDAKVASKGKPALAKAKPAVEPKVDKADKADKADKKADDKKADDKDTKPANWVIEKPSADTQTQKTADERGINPCNTPDKGWGVYDKWSRAPSMGQMISPGKGAIAANGGFDVMFHFHGHEPVRKEWTQVMDGAVLVGIDLGIGSGPYASAFSSPEAFKKLVDSVEKAMAEKTGKKNAHVRHVGLSSWSAGYGAVGEILQQPLGKKLVDTVILLDGLHSGYNGESLNELQLRPFVDFAKDAAARHKLMFVSHSSIIPPGYASTTETAKFLIEKVGGKPKKTKPRGADPMGLDLNARFSKGSFHVRGYNGNDKMDHCAHIGLLRDVLKVHVKSRWDSPKGHAKN
ncbi:MAG: hypothetical protein IT377_31440 [Polyangiaceae bacterium]|nr:hypothetical protein [Polyangiaceae bacterium]